MMTTKRRTPWTIAVTAMLMVASSPRDASAIVGWVEKMSGPGPYLTFFWPFDRLLCDVRKKDGTLGTGHLFGGDSEASITCSKDGGADPTRIRGYVSIEYVRYLENLNHTDFKTDIDAFSITPLFFRRLNEAIDIGTGVNFTKYGGKGVKGGEGGMTRVSLPVRARLYIPWGTPKPWLRAFSVTVGGDYHLAAFDKNDFDDAPNGYRVENEWLLTVGVHYDLLRVISGRFSN